MEDLLGDPEKSTTDREAFISNINSTFAEENLDYVDFEGIDLGPDQYFDSIRLDAVLSEIR
ncbi:MAG: hypothetical protein H7A21_14035 [Spirochaetales bacterium]|nr:hypothetical protein [Spirochaetales bacterium]MCP5485142.1 hypothetical protein [Spirochaetales bacterium]